MGVGGALFISEQWRTDCRKMECVEKMEWASGVGRQGIVGWDGWAGYSARPSPTNCVCNKYLAVSNMHKHMLPRDYKAIHVQKCKYMKDSAGQRCEIQCTNYAIMQSYQADQKRTDIEQSTRCCTPRQCEQSMV